MKKNWLLEDADLTMDAVILLFAGMTLLLIAALLVPVAKGMLPFYESGMFGLLLFIYALQMISLGKTPFGELPKSSKLQIGAIILAASGFITCFIPGISGEVPRCLLVICLGPGGISLLWSLYADRQKHRAWVKHGGILTKLSYSCATVYILSVLTALVIRHPFPTDAALTIGIFFAYGLALIVLALVLRRVQCVFPPVAVRQSSGAALSADMSALLLMGVFMVLLGLLLVPVSMALLPFSGSAQLGMLMCIFSVRMLASGSTPVGAYRRSWLIVLLGLLFAVLGIISCVIPRLLLLPLTWLIGLLNVADGLIGLYKHFRAQLQKSEAEKKLEILIVKKLFFTQVTLSLLAILFGSSMLIADLIPELWVGVILTANGCVLLYLLHLLLVLDELLLANEAVQQ